MTWPATARGFSLGLAGFFAIGRPVSCERIKPPPLPICPVPRRRPTLSTEPPELTPAPACPWADLDEHGSGLSVDNFISSWMNQLSHALRRTLTLSYAEPFGVSVAEWRMLAFISHEGQLSFSQLAQLSSTDKALVSRTLKLLEQRGLVQLQASGRGRARKLMCRLSPAGLDLHDQMIRVARERQAAMLRVLSPTERQGLYQTLNKLKAECARQDRLHDAAHQDSAPLRDKVARSSAPDGL